VRPRWTAGLAALTVAALAGALLVAPLPLGARLPGALVLFVALPGWLFVQAVFNGMRPGPLERSLLALGCGYVLAVLLALVLHALFRPLSTTLVLLAANLLNGGLLLAALARRAELRPPLALPGWPLLAVLVVAAPFRLFNLDHSEFQGDEALVTLRTMAVLQGVPDALIAHPKPPGEILLSATFAGGLDAITELAGRLPFSLAGVVAVLACYQLGRVLFGWRTGLVAALLLAVNGYFVAFARILQYQSVVLLLDILAVLCLFRFARGSTVQRGYAIVGALLVVGSGLMALSAVFLLPVAALALWPRIVGPKRVPWRELTIWSWPLVLLIPSAIAIYVFVPRGQGDTLDLASTWRYLAPRLGERRLYFNLQDFLVSANHYTSGLYALVMLGAGVLVLFKALYDRSRNVAVPAGSARRSLGWTLTLVWLAGPLLTHLFLVRLPWTHWREVFPGLVVLVGVAAAGLYTHLVDRRARLAALLVGTLFLMASGHYVYVAWVQPWPEYQVLYPRYRHPLDWSSRTVRHGAGGTFGAAHRHGWKALGELVANGQLPSAYTTNERSPLATWYLQHYQVCPNAATLLIRAPTSLREHQAIERGESPPGYTLTGRVNVRGRPTLALLARNSPPGPPQAYESDEYGRQFDQELASPWRPVGHLYRPHVNAAPNCPRTR
jgi:hypothetical protein